MSVYLKTVEGNRRQSTQTLLQEIYAAMARGERDFEIDACGQHDIGGPLWSPDGELKFTVRNPGQRLGSMAMAGTTIVVEGSAPADTGWLNSGGEIIVKGDSGDTTAHCAASGRIYIGGRVGTRSGSLMKHDPAYDAPELWVLKTTGSFSFEFMGGGTAVVCGVDAEPAESVLGDRACVGMVGGTVYFRGHADGIAATVRVFELVDADRKFLGDNLAVFLHKIDRGELQSELEDWSQWHEIIPLSYQEREQTGRVTVGMAEFRRNHWIPGGIFGNIYPDDGRVVNLVNRGDDRLRTPEWLNAVFMAPCEANCPAGIPSQTRFNLLREGKLEEAYRLILEYTPFPGSVCGAVCPNLCMEGCSRCTIDRPTDIKGLGRMSTFVNLTLPPIDSHHRIAVIGAGAGGLTAAWLLRLRGFDVTVFERDDRIGGKLVQAVSRERLDTATVTAEIDRIKNAGIHFKLNTAINAAGLQELQEQFDYVVLAIGAYRAKIPPWEGRERIIPYLDFLRRVNAGQRPEIGRKVVVIGCGNSGMDVVFGAYACGAEQVTAIDIQQPAAFAREIARAQSLGAQLRWPVATEKITADGVVLQDGTLLEADTVFCCIGETPVLAPLLPDYPTERGYLKIPEDGRIGPKLFAVGDMTRLGLLAAAIGAARNAVLRLTAECRNEPYAPRPRLRIPAERLALGYFSAVDTTETAERPEQDCHRCISCGTCRDCEMCLRTCPEHAITRTVNAAAGTFEYVSDPELCLGCGICAGVCPCGIWTMRDDPTPEAETPRHTTGPINPTEIQ
ncbi:MAG: FAD-dependent oxidoreductase [Victivallales bacterium]|nr:FAD-dependent oxidoreductase [Victivallales bacterium]